MSGEVFYSHAVKWGKGGNVEAIMNLKVFVTVVLVSIQLGELPSTQEDIGMFIGLSGAFMISLYKQDDKNEWIK